MRSEGHLVDVADGGKEGITAVATKSYDLMFMDISMPEISGLEATQAIRQIGGEAATAPIIAITAHALEGYKDMRIAA